jgi:hypothetical protein
MSEYKGVKFIGMEPLREVIDWLGELVVPCTVVLGEKHRSDSYCMGEYLSGVNMIVLYSAWSEDHPHVLAHEMAHAWQSAHNAIPENIPQVKSRRMSAGARYLLEDREIHAHWVQWEYLREELFMEEYAAAIYRNYIKLGVDLHSL